SSFIRRQVNVTLSQECKQITSRVVVLDKTESLIRRVFCLAEASSVKRRACLSAILPDKRFNHAPARISCHQPAQTLGRALTPVVVTFIGNRKISAHGFSEAAHFLKGEDSQECCLAANRRADDLRGDRQR